MKALALNHSKAMANVKVRVHLTKHKGQKLHAPDLSTWGHKNFDRVSACTSVQADTWSKFFVFSKFSVCLMTVLLYDSVGLLYKMNFKD